MRRYSDGDPTDYPVHKDNYMCLTPCWVLGHEVGGIGQGSPKLCQSVALQVHFLNFIHIQFDCLCFLSTVVCMRCTACYACPNPRIYIIIFTIFAK